MNYCPLVVELYICFFTQMKFWTGYFCLLYPETLLSFYSESEVVTKTTWDIFETISLFIFTHLKLYGTLSKLIFLFCLRYQISKNLNQLEWSILYGTNILFKLLFCNLYCFTWVDEDSGIEVVSYTWITIILSRATHWGNFETPHAGHLSDNTLNS